MAILIHECDINCHFGVSVTVSPVIYSDSDVITVMILSFQTNWSGQIVQTQIRLLLEEQSDQGL